MKRARNNARVLGIGVGVGAVCVLIGIQTALLGGCAKPEAQAQAHAAVANPANATDVVVTGANLANVTAAVATVNGEVVEAREFAAFLMAERSKVYAYFQSKYGAEDSHAFWNKPYNGETPMDKIISDTWKKVVAAKVQQSLGVQAGFLQDTSYTAYLKQLQAENERRLQAARNGKPIYGPKQLEAKTYYDMRQSQLLEDLRRRHNESDVVADADITAYYEANKRDFMKAGSTKVRMITLVYPMANDAAGRLNAENRLQEIAKRVAAGEDFQTVTDGYCSNQPTVFSCKEQTFDGTTAKMDVMTHPALAAAAKPLIKEEVSGIIEDNQMLSLLQAVDKQAESLVPLSEVSKGIAQKLSDQAFERFLQDQANLARLTKNEEAMKAAAAQVLLSNK
ncbi:peptidyl-prolyl cis-trans isomerase [Paenibacillus koleovorans]|uniref:peptidyl-prolyl cis-trans isomerase n=1 Tax=Paenibacillus koleovorans TaxID=121608 RepID=UPI000FD8AC06|nr:peptidyl-prolyl cis-trans isomerase [Paenibacillus koleovorans]